MGECPRCGASVALHEGKPFVSTAGKVELWHPSCWQVRHARPVEEVTVIAPSPRRRAHVFSSGAVATISRNARSARRAAVALGALAVVGAASYSARVDRGPRTSVAAISVDPVELPSSHAFLTEHEEVPPVPDVTAAYPIPTVRGTPLDELYPSLDGWVHPVVGSDLQLPRYTTGMFGAERVGVYRNECGGGHCGADISGPIGRPVIAVADGVVVHIERSEKGRDGRSGRYVRIEHADGVLTAYMHLSSIRNGIDVGTHVHAGDQIGALGASGVVSAAPHLHFSVEIPNVPGTHGDNVNTHYVDPAPFLVRATIEENVDRSHPQRAAF
jgi:murein DD-endopeptidase MepM/ murein hydrolase activator NlpD